MSNYIFELFSEIDYDQKGFIIKKDIKKFLTTLNYPIIPNQIRQIFQEGDLNNDNKIQIDEFEQLFTNQKSKIQQIFEQIDLNNDGYLNREEIMKTFQKQNFSDQQIEKLVSVLDFDKDNHISLKEFVKFYFLLPSENIKALFDIWERASEINNQEFVSIPIEKDNKVPTQDILIAGAVAGAFSRTVTAPLDRLKTLMQSQTKENSIGIVKGFVNIYQKQGIKGFFRGNGTNVIKIAPETAFQMLLYDKIKAIVSSGRSKQSPFEMFLSGSLAGISSTVLFFPIDIAKTKLALTDSSVYKGLFDCVQKINKQEGLKGLYKGILPTLYGVIPYAGINLTTYQLLRDYYIQNCTESPSPIVLMGCGGISSLCGQVFAYPFSLVRTKLQMQGIPGFKQQYEGMGDCFIKVFKQDGFCGYFRGILPCIMKAMPAVSLSFGVFEYIKKELKQQREEK
ncbi:solute carrier family 25, putative [Ichthyophthirius multifiliis]|uniref:Solute carrier family 25, putative n=1 Tax=Ichthyophthirius multifiliis TaxID=5932 RepID=G0QQN6_ICHMU|nr:solute carrier family 25, putative [Ichthyophthirius multifiliis]EGR32468.1 solute carrier family 25, putative [Ichthyophthirius multifiliis]|eukprot:XP_004036454.1 solute carrier family 25, putative [Ichthyophthirius multifiliis]